MKRVFIVAKVQKPAVATALATLEQWLEGRAQVVGIETNVQHDVSKISADLILILGGDGTLLSVARRLKGTPIPLMGINFGRLGFLSSFTPGNYLEHLERYFSAGLPLSARQVIEASVLPSEVVYDRFRTDECCAKARFTATALNDAVVTAGLPFHMIELEVSADSEGGVSCIGDGVIVSTSSGSTAYNVSAGGPIISPDVEAFCITPICPHSLSFRPVVVSSRSVVQVVARRVNAGTTLFCDGQESTRLFAGEAVIVRRSANQVLLIEDPDAREWRSLAEKLNWAVGPRYNESQ